MGKKNIYTSFKPKAPAQKSNVNGHGLGRTPPADVKRAIRQQSGYGCVLCGVAIVEYAHVDPPFKDAREHVPEAMTLLCPNHHTRFDRALIARETIDQAMRNPRAKRDGYASEWLDIGRKEPPSLRLGGSMLQGAKIPIRVDELPLFEILSPEEDGAVFRLNGKFFDVAGNLALEIAENEWRASVSNWMSK